MCHSNIRTIRHVQMLTLFRAVLIGWKVQFWASSSWDWLRSSARWDAALPLPPLLEATTVGLLSVWSSLSTTTMVNTNTRSKKIFSIYKCRFLWIFLSSSICSYLRRPCDRGGVHGEDLGEAPCHSVRDQESVRCRQHGATHLLHLWCGLHILLFSTRLSSSALCWGTFAHCLPAHCPRSNTQSPVW